MKGKKYKRSQNQVQNLYEKYFGIRKPYQIIVDAPFCIETMKIKVAPVEALTEVFGGTVKLMTTPCIQAELQRHDRLNDAGASFVARRFEIRRCQHDKGSKTGSECLKDLVSSNNPHHYCIAGQDIELRKDLRKIPGVPLIFILRDTVLMEPPTEKCLEIAKKMEKKKLKNVDLKAIKTVTNKITSSLKTINQNSSQDSDETEKVSVSKVIKKKKTNKSKLKNPNPLSCKKSKLPKPNSNLKTTTSEASTSTPALPKKKPRKRSHSKMSKTEIIQSGA